MCSVRDAQGKAVDAETKCLTFLNEKFLLTILEERMNGNRILKQHFNEESLCL